MDNLTFWTPERVIEFWGYVKNLLGAAAPGLMIMVAASAVAMIIKLIVQSFRKSEKDDDDDEIEVRHY